MSEPAMVTGRTELRACGSCGSSVDWEETIGLYGTIDWFCQSHLAPCGLPCFGGGVSVRAYGSGEAHGLAGYPPGFNVATEWDEGGPYDGMVPRPCPACTGLPAVPSAEVERIPHPGWTE